MKTFLNKSFSDVIGNTPLIKLRSASKITKCNIYGKCEFLNPGGSVKDRAALQIITDALKSGAIKKGGTVIEGTAGNTGIGLSLVGNSLGLKTVIVMSETQSQEKIKMLELCGADLRLVKDAPYKDPRNYIRVSERLSKQIKNKNGVFWANQFDNLSNCKAHFKTTGPEIWSQTKGKINAFICAVGTGGTLAGVSNYLKKQNSKITIGLADPHGASMYSYFKTGKLEGKGTSITEGIGQGRVTKNVNKISLDEAFRISDKEALEIVYKLIREEGLILGGSSGINIAGAIKLAKKMGPGKTIVTILCDYGTRYESKIFNKRFLKIKKLPIPKWL